MKKACRIAPVGLNEYIMKTLQRFLWLNNRWVWIPWSSSAFVKTPLANLVCKRKPNLWPLSCQSPLPGRFQWSQLWPGCRFSIMGYRTLIWSTVSEWWQCFKVDPKSSGSISGQPFQFPGRILQPDLVPTNSPGWILWAFFCEGLIVPGSCRSYAWISQLKLIFAARVNTSGCLSGNYPVNIRLPGIRMISDFIPPPPPHFLPLGLQGQIMLNGHDFSEVLGLSRNINENRFFQYRSRKLYHTNLQKPWSETINSILDWYAGCTIVTVHQADEFSLEW